MFELTAILAAPSLLGSAKACPGARQLRKRQAGGNITNIPATEWAYEASYNWGPLDPAYDLCQTGSQQSPIPLRLDQGLSLRHAIAFDYGDAVDGNFYNWGYGPAFEIVSRCRMH
jgi:carbonic anhydrase